MTQSAKAPGKSFRKGMSLVQAVRRFSNEERTERWFIQSRWPDGVICPRCGSENIKERPTRKPQPFRCYDCRKDFSVKTGTVMQGSNLSLGTWALAAYILTTNLKGVSSMKLHRDLGITQKTAWHLAHRIREAWEDGSGLFGGTVEADEAYIGGKEHNKHEVKKQHSGRGAVGKAAVAGVKERESGEVRAKVIDNPTGANVQEFVRSHTDWSAMVYTDESAAYHGLNRMRETVNHSAKEYVRGQAHTNGMESFWANLKRGHNGVYHHFSVKHLSRYIKEFAGRHNARPMDTEDQLRGIVSGMVGRTLRYRDLIGAKQSGQPRLV